MVCLLCGASYQSLYHIFTRAKKAGWETTFLVSTGTIPFCGNFVGFQHKSAPRAGLVGDGKKSVIFVVLQKQEYG
jgi:hypothetical protein